MRRRIREAAPTYTNGYSWCPCGSLAYFTNGLNEFTTFNYDLQSRVTSILYPDSATENFDYNAIGQVIHKQDVTGSWTTNFYNNQGLLEVASNAFGLVLKQSFDILDRATNVIDANGVSITNTFDDLGRILTSTYPDTNVEKFGYSPLGLVTYTNQLGKVTSYAYDPAGRKTAETNANTEVTQFSYDPASNLLTLTDGNNSVTTWNYDVFGRATNKIDAANNVIFVYKYDANNRLTNRWTPAKTNTVYSYDPAGNITNIAYPVSHGIAMKYDALNRVTSMVDGVGTTTYAFTSGGPLASEDGPWDNDTVSYSYNNRLRNGLRLSQPNAADWVQSYGYDSASRLTNVTSPAGAFGYGFDSTRQLKVQKTTLPNAAYITNAFDSVGRTLATALRNSTNGSLNSHVYGYNKAGYRTAMTNVLGDYRKYQYDQIGQLTSALGNESNNILGFG